MSKHAQFTLLATLDQQAPKHSKGWEGNQRYVDYIHYSDGVDGFYTPGKHAKPFGKHHPATPITEATPANVTPLFPTATVLDVAA